MMKESILYEDKNDDFEGYQNVAVPQHIITEHVDPPQSISLNRNMESP